jgi:Uma2 family endonuclease
MGAHPATASPLVRRYTLEQFLTLDPPKEGGHYELIAGVLYMVPPPTGRHHLVAARLMSEIATWAHGDRGAVVFFPRAAIWTPEGTYLEPDLFLVRATTLQGQGGDAGRLRTADLVVEILSPESATYDRTAKADTYAALGVQELWIVDPEKGAIEQRALEGTSWSSVERPEAAVVRSHAFPGLTIALATIFA